MAKGIDGFLCELYWNMIPDKDDPTKLLEDDGNVGIVVKVILHSDGERSYGYESASERNKIEGDQIIDWFRPRLEKLIHEFNYLDE